MTCQLVFFDTEDTDLDDTPEQAAKVEIIEYAAVRWTDGNAQPLLHDYCLPRNGCTEQAAKVNGYDEKRWLEMEASHFSVCDVNELRRALDGQMLAGSNPDFDMRMVKRECERIRQAPPKWSHRSVNTASAAIFMWLQGLVEKTSLDVLGKFFGLEAQRHTALDDCYRAIKVFEGMHDLYVYQPKVMREGLLEIAADPLTDATLRDYASTLAEGRAE